MTALPPNQALAAPGRWPLVGERTPRDDDAPWSVTVDGLVAAPRVWTLDELRAAPSVERSIDLHCVTRWSKLGVVMHGVPLSHLLAESRPAAGARFVSFVARSARGHSTSLPLAACDDVLVVLEADGAPLALEHGGPVRTVKPGRYFYKSLKWLERVELLADDRLGWWEREAGYHNEADPWQEQRYIAASLDKRTAERVLADRDFRGLDLRGLAADGMDLAGLRAEAALVRDGRFRRANLRGARFDRANLSNARLDDADLRDASFAGADLEGADFRGADLRGADLRGSSLFGTTFVDPEGADRGAAIDATTRLDPTDLEPLAPVQQDYLARARRAP